MTPANIAGPQSQFTRSLRGVQALIQALTGAAEERLRRREYMARETERELARGERRERFEWEKTRAQRAFEAAEEERKQRMAIARQAAEAEYGPIGAAAAAPVSGVGAPAEITGTGREAVIERLARKQAMSAEADARAKGVSEAEVVAAGRQAYRQAKVAAAGMRTRRARELEKAIPAPTPIRATVTPVEPEEPLAARYARFVGRLGPSVKEPEEWLRLAEALGSPRATERAAAERELEAIGVTPAGVRAMTAGRFAAAPTEAELGEYIQRQRAGRPAAGRGLGEILGQAPRAIERALIGIGPPLTAQEAAPLRPAPRPRGPLPLPAVPGRRGARVRLPQPGEDPEIYTQRMAQLGATEEEIDEGLRMGFPFPTHTRD